MRKRFQAFFALFFYRKRGAVVREYRYLTHDDRLLIEKLYARGIAPSDIASVVGVSLATGRKGYSAAKAQQTVDQNIKRRGRSPADTKKGTE